MSSPYAERAVCRTRQRGVALITILLVFVLASIMTTAMLRSSYLAIHRTTNLIESAQARYYALGAEELGRQILKDDAPPAGAPNPTDTLAEAWAKKDMQFEIEDGKLEINIIDAAGLFNLNDLVDKNGRIDPVAVTRFARLLQLLRLDQSLAFVVADWADKDSQTTRGSSEQSAYGRPQIPNVPLADISELLAMPGFETEVYHKLAPFVATVPKKMPLNMNTAPDTVLSAYAVPGAEREVERFARSRLVSPLKTKDDPVAAKLFGANAAQMDVRSEVFIVRSHAEYRKRHARIDTLLFRDSKTGRISVLGRSDAAKL